MEKHGAYRKRANRLAGWFIAMNRLPIFHPARWPHGEAAGRATALLIIAAFLGWKIHQFDLFPQTFDAARRFYSSIILPDGTRVYSATAIGWLWGVKLAVWIVETAIYIGYVMAYLSRSKAVALADGFMETAFPVIVAGLPVLLAFAPYNLPSRIPFSSQGHLPFFLAVMTAILTGGVINLVGLLTLRRAFTIMTEARVLVRQGIFRYVRHPLYTGHFIMFFGSLLLRLHSYTLAFYLLFCIGQIWRARNEERKLTQSFPDYIAYRQETGMFWPTGVGRILRKKRLGTHLPE